MFFKSVVDLPVLNGELEWWVCFYASEKPVSGFRNPHLVLHWQQRLERFDQSELTIAPFCQLEGYSTASYCQWRRKLRQSPRLKDGAFIPVPVDPDPTEQRAGGRNQIDLPGGVVIKFPRDATTNRGHYLSSGVHAPSSPALLPRTDASSTGVGPGEKGARAISGRLAPSRSQSKGMAQAMRPVASFQGSDAVAEDRTADSVGGGGRDGVSPGERPHG